VTLLGVLLGAYGLVGAFLAFACYRATFDADARILMAARAGVVTLPSRAWALGLLLLFLWPLFLFRPLWRFFCRPACFCCASPLLELEQEE
jgi:hypothetical protein